MAGMPPFKFMMCMSFGVCLIVGSETATACGDGKLLYEDVFETLDPAWGFAADDATRTNGPGGLTYKLPPGDSVGLLNQSDLYVDYEVCADFTLNLSAAKSASYASVAFWFSDTDNGYWAYFLPAPEWGTFGVNRVKAGKTIYPVSEMKSAAIHKGMNTTNEISVIVKGTKATVLINGDKVIDFTGRPPDTGSLFGFNMGAGKDDAGVSTLTLKRIQLRAVDQTSPVSPPPR